MRVELNFIDPASLGLIGFSRKQFERADTRQRQAV
jgi:hypothetical protein